MHDPPSRTALYSAINELVKAKAQSIVHRDNAELHQLFAEQEEAAAELLEHLLSRIQGLQR